MVVKITFEKLLDNFDIVNFLPLVLILAVLFLFKRYKGDMF